MKRKEVYVVTFTDGNQANVVAETFGEVLMRYGEENVITMHKIWLDDDIIKAQEERT